ncbi:MAG: alcohol dehydrogenase catalytic domain-containing protein, partial [Flavobacteriaceae bacterium]|nr:alcohol dehydrogenase catalytic domain-containing protein [Flavobacteriaceae bacterium]
MKASHLTRYGSADHFILRDIARPEPKDDEMLIKIIASSINSWDWEIVKATPFINRLMVGLFKPSRIQVLGCDIAGRVEAVGSRVTRFRV